MQEDQLGFKEKKIHDGANREKGTAGEKSLYRTKNDLAEGARLKGCTWKRKHIEFSTNYAFGLPSSGAPCAWFECGEQGRVRQRRSFQCKHAEDLGHFSINNGTALQGY